MTQFTELTHFICENVNRPFQWGKFDCCMFAADAIKIMSGVDPATEFRGRYRSASGAYKQLKKHGYNNVDEVLRAKLGKPIPRLQCNQGDIASISTPEGIAAGVIFGASIYAPGPEGMTATPLKKAINIYGVNRLCLR